MKKHVLIVEDEAEMRDLLRDFLQSQGYQVTCYASATSALKSLHNGSNPDAVVSDILMNPMNGIDLLKNIKSYSPKLPVLLFTAAGSIEQKKQSMELGASQYFVKPFPLSDLKASLEKALRKPRKT